MKTTQATVNSNLHIQLDHIDIYISHEENIHEYI